MTNKNILKAFSALDADIVIGCEPSAAPVVNKKKKKPIVLRLVAVAACVALLATGIVVGTLLLNREDDQPDVLAEKTEYVVYIDAAMDANAPPIETDKFTVKTDTADELDISCLKKVKIERLEGTPDKISLNLLNNHWDAEYNRTFERGLYKSDNFSHLGIYDEYTSGGVTIYINKANGELMYLSDNKIDRAAEGDFTAEEAVKEAEEILVLLYGNEVFEYYGEPVFVDKVAESNINGAQQYVLKVVYEKNVLGYRTDDRITVKFNMEGKLVSVNAMKRNTMSCVEQDITKEQVDKALSVLIEQIPDDKIESLRISVAADGNYYITADVIRYLSMHPIRYSLRFSINIQ